MSKQVDTSPRSASLGGVPILAEEAPHAESARGSHQVRLPHKPWSGPVCHTQIQGPALGLQRLASDYVLVHSAFPDTGRRHQHREEPLG